MTLYYGGKTFKGKTLATAIWITSSIIELEEGITFKGYCEPFCGMLGVYTHIPELFKDHKPVLEYKAGDINESVVMMWQKAQKGWKPPTSITEEEYKKLKTSKNSALKGYVGHQYAYGGVYFSAFSPKYGRIVNPDHATKKISKIANNLKNAQFNFDSYEQYSDLEGYIIYCDPPYENTSSPYHDDITGKPVIFDHTKFWDWCRKMATKNLVYVSTYTAPKDMKCIYTNKHKITGHLVKNRSRTERLYLV